MLLLCSIRMAESHLFWKELFIWFYPACLCEYSSICIVCVFFFPLRAGSGVCLYSQSFPIFRDIPFYFFRSDSLEGYTHITNVTFYKLVVNCFNVNTNFLRQNIHVLQLIHFVLQIQIVTEWKSLKLYLFMIIEYKR